MGLGSNSSLTTSCLLAVCPWVCHLTSLSLTWLPCRMGVTIPPSQGVPSIAEILYIKHLVLSLAYSQCSVVVLVSNQEDLGRLLGVGGDTS